jgi:hypothetical protein
VYSPLVPLLMPAFPTSPRAFPAVYGNALRKSAVYWGSQSDPKPSNESCVNCFKRGTGQMGAELPMIIRRTTANRCVRKRGRDK